MAARLPLPYNPLKTTTSRIYQGWLEEMAQLQHRLHELQTGARDEQGWPSEEAEGVHLRLQALRDLIAGAAVVEGDPGTWQTQVSQVRLGSKVRIEFDDGETGDFLFVGLAGPTDGDVLTPKTPLGSAILGRRVGERIAYRVGQTLLEAVVRQCLIPGRRLSRGPEARLRFICARDAREEAAQVASAIVELLRGGTPPAEIVLAWRAQYQSWPHETSLAGLGIPYRLEGVEGFYDQAAIQSLLSLVRLAFDPGDRPAFFEAMRAFTSVPAGVAEALRDRWNGPEETGIPASVARKKGATGLLRALHELPDVARDEGPAGVLIDCGRRFARLRPDLFGKGFTSPFAALNEAILTYHEPQSFLKHADAIARSSRRGSRDGVVLTSLPLLGGREFSVLFLVGVNEGALPFPGDPLTSERELFYEALGAAKQATVSWSKSACGRPAKPSRFLKEISS